jgi:hypothetical protein
MLSVMTYYNLKQIVILCGLQANIVKSCYTQVIIFYRWRYLSIKLYATKHADENH